MIYNTRNKKVKLSLSTILAIPLIVATGFFSGYMTARAEDYLSWRMENIEKFTGWKENGLYGRVMKEAAMIQVYRHREDTRVINTREKRQEPESRIEEVKEENHYFQMI